jgi:hypothetical protein
LEKNLAEGKTWKEALHAGGYVASSPLGTQSPGALGWVPLLGIGEAGRGIRQLPYRNRRERHGHP